MSYKKKIFKIIKVVLFTLIVGALVVQTYQRLDYGDPLLREKFVAEIVWSLSEEGIDQSDVEYIAIEYGGLSLSSPSYSGARYQARVSVKGEEHGRHYMWKDWNDGEPSGVKFWYYTGFR